jgi:F-type H+-transporting ATPase subunit delta
MSDVQAGARYARAIFNLAEKERALPKIEALLAFLVKTTEGSPEVTAVIRNPVLKESEKADFIGALIPADSPALFRDFLRVLIEKKRFSILGEIQSEFHRRFAKQQGLLEVEVLSAVPFSKTLQEKLKKTLSVKLRSEIKLIPKTDASLIGGFLLRFNGREIDCSYKNRLHEIEQQLMA